MKFLDLSTFYIDVKSHPSRGAWIEIAGTVMQNVLPRVAPLTGCVD